MSFLRRPAMPDHVAVTTPLTTCGTKSGAICAALAHGPGLTGFEQTPDALSQVPISWHASDAVHTTGLLPAHAPFWHVFVRKQRFVPVHTVPLGWLASAG